MKPTVPEVEPLVRSYYSKHPTGGALHIVLDDGNVTDAHVRLCMSWARLVDDHEGENLASVLLKMSRTQRLKLAMGRKS